MHIEQDSVIDQRWLVTPTRGSINLLDQKLMKAAMEATYGETAPGTNDVWFHEYVSARLSALPDGEPLTTWLEEHSARHVWQPVLSTVDPTFTSPRGWDSFKVHVAFATYQVALVLLDRGVAALFKMAVPTLLPEQPDDMSRYSVPLNKPARWYMNA